MRSTPLHPEAAGAAPPDAFGPFRVLHQIGAGALGAVFRAYDPDQDRLVAVKLFQLDLPPERAPQLVASLQKLIDADLAHAAIAAPLATGLVGTSVYLAQDFVAADSLDEVAREFGRASVADAVRVAGQLAAALDFAAAAGVFHGVLHPRDILLASDDARMTGLGVAQALADLGLRPTIRRPYTAPERSAGQPWDHRSDVYSLAVLIAEMLSGRRSAGTGARLLDGWTDPAVTDLAGFQQAFARATADQPGDRYESATTFADALRRSTENAAASESPAITAPRPRLMTRPEPLLEPSLPLDVPSSQVPETLLPGDAPRDLGDDAVWESESPSDLEQYPAEPEPAEDDPAVEEPAPPTYAAAAVPPILHAPAHRPEVTTHDLELRALDESFSAKPPVIPHVAIATEQLFRGPAAPPPEVPVTRVDGPRDTALSAVWPITLALTVGLIVGVAVGFFVFGDRLSRGDEVANAPAAVSESAPTDTVAAATPPPAPPTAAPVSSPETQPVPEAAPPPAARPSTPPPAARSSPPPAARSSRPPAAPVERSMPPAPRRNAVEPPAAVPPNGGRLLVRSSPAGARVELDSQEVGVTPLTLRSLSIGTHSLRVTQDGYLPEDRRVIITTAQPAQSLIVELVRRVSDASPAATSPPSSSAVRYTAPLVIESRPPGAAVFLNGRHVGTTPLTLEGVPAGSHALRLELDGYRRWTSAVRVAAGERNRITASLEQ